MAEIDYGRLDQLESALGGREAIAAAYKAGHTLLVAGPPGPPGSGGGGGGAPNFAAAVTRAVDYSKAAHACQTPGVTNEITGVAWVQASESQTVTIQLIAQDALGADIPEQTTKLQFRTGANDGSAGAITIWVPLRVLVPPNGAYRIDFTTAGPGSNVGFVLDQVHELPLAA